MREETITSVQNALVKRLYQLQSRKGREESKSFLVEGAHLVEEALRSQMEVVSVIYDAERGIHPDCEMALTESQQRIQRIAVSPTVMDKLAETKSPQGILAEVKMEQRQWESWWEDVSQRDFLLLFLDEIQDPGNLGTILRTADAAGVDAVILGEGSVDLYNSKVIRSTMGSLFRLPVFTRKLIETMGELREAGASLLVTSLSRESRPYDESLYSGKVAIVIGNEARGVSPEIIAQSTQAVHIPLYGKAESLNAAVAAGIMLYEARRQRKERTD